MKALQGLSAQRWRLQPGIRSAQLRAAYLAYEVDCACYLTACNPLGQLLSAAENTVRMQQLERAHFAFTPGFGQDPQAQWPGEDSVLVWGMDIGQARQWGQHWQQNAVLCCDADADAVPQLLWLR